MDTTEQFVARENIRRFESLIVSSPDDKQKKVLRQLLAQERERLAALNGMPATERTPAEVTRT